MTQRKRSRWYLIVMLALIATSGMVGGCTQSQDPDREGTVIRQLEIDRLRSLVHGDMDVAERLHADDFQLITPDGSEYTKQTYLGGIASGELDYLVWEPGEIRVRLYGDAAVIRYDDSQFEIAVNGELARIGTLRHTTSMKSATVNGRSFGRRRPVGGRHSAASPPLQPTVG